MADIQHTVSGEGAPQSPPPSVGAHYTDTVSGAQYLAAGTASVGDWKQVFENSGWDVLPAEGSNQYPPSARRINGVVHLRGFCWIEENLVDGYVAKLPAGWEPALNLTIYQTNSSRTRRIIVEGADGFEPGRIAVYAEAGGSGADYISFDGISFPAG